MRTIVLLAALAGGVADSEITGYISDAACGWNNARPSKEAKECAVKCVREGWDPVFVRDGQTAVIKISNKKMVLPYVGDHVAIMGKLEGDAYLVRKIRVAAPPAAKGRK